MKKKVLAMLLGGVMAVGALSIQMPSTVQAAIRVFDRCDGSISHINSNQVTFVDGKLTVTIDIDFELEEGEFGLYVFDKQLKGDDIMWYNMSDPSRVAMLEELKEGGTYTFDGLESGKTYYLYCRVIDNHECNEWGEGGERTPLWDNPAYLGPFSSGGTSSQSPSADSAPSNNAPSATAPADYYKEAEKAMIDQIKGAEAGSTVVMKEGITTLSNAVMKELLNKGDVSLKLEFTYNEEGYVIVIPAGAALDNDIPWYGPLYLAQQYGNSAGAAGAGGTYEVKRGDTLGKIAKANNMTLKQLLAKNPQIKDANKINVGQKINR